MSDGLFYPMAPAHSVPTIIRRYHYQHLPPPSNPTEFMSSLRHGLRGANEVGLWGKLKGAGWRFLRECRVSSSQSVWTNNFRAVKFDNYNMIPLRPDFPVAPPGTPGVPTPLPDVHITPATSPGFDISPPLPQEEGFLAVPVRTSRGRTAEVPRPRKLPTPPGFPPPYSVQEAERRRRTNIASHSSTNEPLTTPDLTTDDIVMALLYADSTVTPGAESASHDDTVESLQRGSSDMVSDTTSVTASSDSASEPRDSPFTPSDVEGIRDTAADTVFLEELGLSANDYRQLLQVVNFVLDEKEED